MYNFSIQKEMYIAAGYLLEKHNLKEVSALGGGTALAAYYWQHRYSTDIDIFTHSKVDISKLFTPSKWDNRFKDMMKKLGYTGDSKIHPIYTEFSIKDGFKMQFLSTLDRTSNPYNLVRLWEMDILLESVEEIAKKIYFRGDKGNARDLFDIALAIHKDPIVIEKLSISLEKIKDLYITVNTIKNDKKLKQEYLTEINLMNPNPKYKVIAQTA